MANPQKPNPQQHPTDPLRKPASPGKPGTERDPYRHPGDQPDVKPDVIADEDRPAKGGSTPGQRAPGAPGGPRSGEGK